VPARDAPWPALGLCGFGVPVLVIAGPGHSGFAAFGPFIVFARCTQTSGNGAGKAPSFSGWVRGCTGCRSGPQWRNAFEIRPALGLRMGASVPSGFRAPPPTATAGPRKPPVLALISSAWPVAANVPAISGTRESPQQNGPVWERSLTG